MKFYDWIWNWWMKPKPYIPDICKPKMHSGKCDLCDNYGIIWLNGQHILCWEHYIEAMQKEID